jgi:hypothetical protein
MTHIRNDRTSRQRRRAGTTLVLAAASGGLLAAAMAASPAARADNPYTDILNDVQNSIAIGEADYTAAATEFSTAGGTNAGLVEEFAGFDNTFISSTDYTLLGLTAAATGTNFSGDGTVFGFSIGVFPLTAAGEQAEASLFASLASAEFAQVTTDFSGGNYFAGVADYLFGIYDDIFVGQEDTLAALFSAGI